MAEAIPRDYFLLPDRYLVQEDSSGSCSGTIIQAPNPSFGPFTSRFTNKRTTLNPEHDPEHPELSPPTITITYTKVVFKRDGAQEVNISGTDCLLIHSNDILAFLPNE